MFIHLPLASFCFRDCCCRLIFELISFGMTSFSVVYQVHLQ
jgi:hypothetical protein